MRDMATTWHGIGTLRWFWNHGRSSLMCNQYFFEKKLPSPKTFKNGLPIILDEPAYILGLLHFWHSEKNFGNFSNSEIWELGEFWNSGDLVISALWVTEHFATTVNFHF